MPYETQFDGHTYLGNARAVFDSANASIIVSFASFLTEMMKDLIHDFQKFKKNIGYRLGQHRAPLHYDAESRHLETSAKEQKIRNVKMSHLYNFKFGKNNSLLLFL